MNCMQKVSTSIEHFFEFIFSKIGYFVFKMPWVSFLVALVVDVILCSGWLMRDYVTDVKDTWIPSNSQSLTDYERYTGNFGSEIMMHSLYVVDEGEDLLTKKNMLKMLDLYDKISANQVFKDTCQQFMPGMCLVNSPLMAFGNQRVAIESLPNDAVLKAALKSSTAINVSAFVGDYNPNTVSSSYVWMMFFQTSENQTAVSEFEAYFDSIREFEGFTIYPNSAGAQGRALSDSIYGDLGFLGISYALCLVFLSLTLGHFKCGKTRILLALVSIVETGLAFAGSIGLGSYCGIKYTPPVSVLPFIVLGIATDSIYLITRFFDTSKKGTLEERFIDSYSLSGATITISTFTNIFAFGIGAITPIPALATFGGFSAICFLLNYFLIFFFTGAAMAIDEKWKASGRIDPFFCCKKEETECSDNQIDQSSSENETGENKFQEMVVKFYDKVIFSVPGMIVLLILFAAMIAVSIYATTTFKVSFTIRQLVPSDSFLDPYYELRETKFNKIDGQISFANADPMKLVTEEGRNEYEKQLASFLKADFMATTNNISNSWIIKYVTDNKNTLTAQNFGQQLSIYLSNPVGARHISDVSISEDKSVVMALKESYSYVPIYDALDTVQMMQDTRKEISVNYLFPWSYEFITAAQYEDIGTQALQNLLLAIAVVFVIVLLMLADIVASLMVTFIVAGIDVGVFGFFLTWWGVDVNTISVGNLVIVIGISVDYSAHVMHSYLNPTGRHKNAVLDAINEVGLAVFMGGISTFLAVFPLAFCKSQIFIIFFKTFFGTILIGLLYSLILLPIILKLIGPKPHEIKQVAHEDNNEFTNDDQEIEDQDSDQDDEEKKDSRGSKDEKEEEDKNDKDSNSNGKEVQEIKSVTDTDDETSEDVKLPEV